MFIKSTITGITGTFTITNDGALYQNNDNIKLIGGGGSICQVENIGQGSISEFYINVTSEQLSNSGQTCF